MPITEARRWQTSDGDEHSSREWAQQWEAKIEAAVKATEMLEQGGSVAECLRAINYKLPIDAILEYVTKDTELVISHWQCRDTPGYKPIRFCPDGRIVAYGHAGSWSGPYGGAITVADLARYAKQRGTIL
jgi:hypothetical protein